MTEKRLTNEERMKLALGVEFADFSATADATFDDRFGEWRVRFFRFDFFHFSTREFSDACRDEALKQAFDYMRLIASHAGQLNICGVFVKEREEIRIFEQKRDFGEIRLAYSEIIKRWFWATEYNLHDGGGGFAVAVSTDVARCSATSREQAILDASERLYECFRKGKYEKAQEETIASAARYKIEEYALQTLGRAAHLARPNFLAAKKIAVQQSLF